jgi:all-trans-8'-apo-beta-carotenal 15,15'-oxygenase
MESESLRAGAVPAERVDGGELGKLHRSAGESGAPGLERLFFFDAEECDYEISEITGAIPEWLSGSYYVNGPARFELGGLRYRNWLDGDGMIQALHFKQGRAHFVSRFVRTRKFIAESEAGRFLYRTFGTAFERDRLRRNVMLEPPVNVSVYPYAGTLLAFGEQALPVELDAHTLVTRGEFDFRSALNEISPFAAHPKIDPTSGHLVNFGMSFSPTQSVLNLYEFDHNASLIRRFRHRLPLAYSMHDFAMTPHYAVFFLSPLLLRFERLRQEGTPLIDSLSWEPERGSNILIVPRAKTSEEPKLVAAGERCCLHFINCFEEGSKLSVDIIELDAPLYPNYQPMPDLFVNVSPGRPMRYRVDLEDQRVVDRIPLAFDRTPDFPAMNTCLHGQFYDEFWVLGLAHSGEPGRKFFDELAHLRWREPAVGDTYRVSAGEYLAGEPIVIEDTNGSSRTRVLIVERIDTRNNSCSFLIFDAGEVSRGPLAQLQLKHRIHPGFHASWQESRGPSSGTS